MELAAGIDVGKETATYDLEGDGGLSLCCYQCMQAVANAWQLNLAQMRFLNLYAVAEDLAATYPDITVGWAESYGRDCVRQALSWFLEKFNVQLYDTMMAFKAARLMCPSIQFNS